MALTVTKTKAKAKAVETETQVADDSEIQNLAEKTLEELADLYGKLDDQVKALVIAPTPPCVTQFALVEAELKKRLETELEPQDEAQLQGDHWLLEIAACKKNARALKEGAIPLVQKFVGAEAFAQIAKVNISDIEKYLTPDQVEKVLNSDTGYNKSRKIVAKFLG